MSLANTAETAILALIFNATAWANIADNAASSPLTNLYVTGHSADPGEAGSQVTSEISYTGYTRAPVARTSGGWTVSGSTASNVAAVSLGLCTAGSATMTHFGVGFTSSGAGALIGSGPISSPSSLPISAGINPTAGVGALIVTWD